MGFISEFVNKKVTVMRRKFIVDRLERLVKNWKSNTMILNLITVGRIVNNDPRVTRNNVLVNFLSLRPAAPWCCG